MCALHSRVCGKTPRILHVPVESAKFGLDGIRTQIPGLHAGLAQHCNQVPQRRAKLVTNTSDGRRAGALRQVAIEEALHAHAADLSDLQTAPGEPPREMRNAAEVDPLRMRRVTSIGEKPRVHGLERSEAAIVQPRSRRRVERKSIHRVSLVNV
jgi:hypothetical protein